MPSSAAKAAIIGCCLAWLLLLGGCSAVRIGYNQASTLTWWWLDGYMDFDAEQAPPVKAAIDQWFAWHRSTQLADYAALLAVAQQQVMQPATPQQVCRWADALRARLDEAFAHGVPLAAGVVPLLKPAQLAHLEQRYRRSNRRFVRAYLQPPEERHKASVERTIDRAEMLYGPLDTRQRELVAAGVAASPFDPERWLAQRQALQAEALQTLSRPNGSPAGLAGLQALAAHVLRAPPGPYRDYQLQLEAYNCAFIAQLHNSTTPQQRQAARDKLAGWEADLRALAGEAPLLRRAAAP